jgi:hypothetical protein
MLMALIVKIVSFQKSHPVANSTMPIKNEIGRKVAALAV